MRTKLLVAMIVCSLSCFAQGMRTIAEDFSQNKFNWDEMASKEGSAFLREGMLMLDNKSDAKPLYTICSLPVLYDEDFKIDCKFDKPDINDKDLVGIVFNYEDEENFWVFLVREKESFIGRFRDGKFTRVRTNPIILKKGKKNDVELQMQRKGKNLIFSVDNMEVKTHPTTIVNNTFGFIIFGKGKLSVSELKVEQYARE